MNQTDRQTPTCDHMVSDPRILPFRPDPPRMHAHPRQFGGRTICARWSSSTRGEMSCLWTAPCCTFSIKSSSLIYTAAKGDRDPLTPKSRAATRALIILHFDARLRDQDMFADPLHTARRRCRCTVWTHKAAVLRVFLSVASKPLWNFPQRVNRKKIKSQIIAYLVQHLPDHLVTDGPLG